MKRLWGGAAAVTGLCLLVFPSAAQARTKPAISPSFIAKVNAYCSAEESLLTMYSASSRSRTSTHFTQTLRPCA